MDDWLRNMGDWNISRRRYYGLPLPLYPCDCGHLNVIGSREELERRALSGLEQLEELRRPWIDRVPVACEQCGEPVERMKEVGDVWLDAGIVPFSTLGWQNPSWIERGYATGAAKGLTTADLPDHAYWEKWFPADWVSEMREQIRLWFYSQLFMSVVLTGRAPFQRVLGYEKMLDECGREMHGSWGNMIAGRGRLRPDGCRRDALAVLRAAAEPEPAVRLRAGARDPARAADVLELGEVPRRLLGGSRASSRLGRARADGVELRPLDSWLVARTRQLVAEATEGYEATLTVNVIRAFEEFVDDVSNWYIRRSRRRFYDFDEAAFRTLWFALVQSLRVMAPVLPFLTDDLWRNLVQDGPESVHLAPWPEVVEPDRALLAEVAEVRTVVTLGRKARDEARLKHRQPLQRLVVAGAVRASPHTRRDRRGAPRSRWSSSARSRRSELRVKPNLPVLGPKLGGALREVREQLRAASSRSWTAAASRSATTCSSPTRCSSSAWASRAGRSSPRTASPSRSTRRSTTTCCSRAACST